MGVFLVVLGSSAIWYIFQESTSERVSSSYLHGNIYEEFSSNYVASRKKILLVCLLNVCQCLFTIYVVSLYNGGSIELFLIPVSASSVITPNQIHWRP